MLKATVVNGISDNELELLTSCTINSGNALSERGNHTDALANLARIASFRPKHHGLINAIYAACIRYGLMLAREGNLSGAESIFRKADGLKPQQPEARNLLSQIRSLQAKQHLADHQIVLAQAAILEARNLWSETPDFGPMLEDSRPYEANPSELDTLATEEMVLRTNLNKGLYTEQITEKLAKNLYNQAEIWIRDHSNNEKAESCLRSAIKLKPNNREIVVLLAITLYNKAINLFNFFDFSAAEFFLWDSVMLLPELSQSREIIDQCISKRASNIVLRSHKYTNRAKALIDLLKVFEVENGKYVRKGTRCDGGYVMLDHAINNSIVYSLGIGWDVSWDLDMANIGCQVYQYDHTIEKLPLENPNFHWSKLGIGTANNNDQNFETISSLILKNGHAHREDLILKIDIEGGEWEILEEIEENVLCQFSQIVGEFHNLFGIADADKGRIILNVFETLNKHFQLIHLHVNNSGSVGNIGGITIYETYELTYVRRRDHSFVKSMRVFPTEFDAPCNSWPSDYALGLLG